MQKHEVSAVAAPVSRSAWLALLLLSIVAAPTLGGAGLAFVASAVASVPLGTALGLFAGGGLIVGAIASGVTALYLVVRPPADQFTTITQGPTRESVRVIPVSGGTKLIDGVPIEDFEFFIDGLSYHGAHTQRRWIGKTCPSGTVIDAAYWKALCMPLRKVKVIDSVRQRSAGHLTTTNPDEIRRMFGLGPRRKF